MRRRMTALFLAIALICAMLPAAVLTASAETYSGSCGENLTWTLDTDTGVLVISGTGDMDNFYWGSIPWRAFQDSIITVNISNNVTSIGDYAFWFCSELANITLSDCISSFGIYSFYGCSNLTDITIPASVNSIGDYAFLMCTGLKSIVVDKNNNVYDSRNNCNALIHTETNTLILGCNNSVIPSGVITVGKSAFTRCADLSEVAIPDSVTSIGEYAFSECTGLTNVTIGDSVTKIGASAFFDCTGLANVTVGSSVTSIGGCAFAGCSVLTSIKLPESVTSIEAGAFNDCTSLIDISIPDSVTSISRSFDNTGYYNDASNWTDGVLYIGHHLIRAKETASGDHSIKAGTRTIAGYAFYGCSKLTNVTIPDSVATIGWWAFGKCNGLTSISIPESVKHIESEAFFDCTGLTDVYFLGAEAQWKAIIIGENNDCLTEANIHFIGSCEHEHEHPEHKDATCTQPGYDRMICDDCGEVLSETVIPALGHDWNDGEITTPATATTDGVKTFTCTRCGETRTEVIPATGEQPCQHEHAYPEHRDATCTEPGYDRMICDDCGEVISETVIPALGHDIVIDETVAATCTEPGLTAGEHCTRCDYKVAQVVVPALGHDIVVDAEIPATCTATGLSAGEHCTRCDYKVAQQETPALGHDWNEGEITTPATETTDGVKTYTCSRCGGTRTEVIPATGEGACQHGHAYPEEKDATCTEPGYVRMICDDCGAVISEELTPALGHALVDYDAKAATCTEAGWNAYQACARCDYTTYEEIAALGHDLVDHEAKAPTCTEIGWDAYQTCSRCDYTTYAELPALEHNFVNGVCTVCGAKDPDYKPSNPFGDVKDTDYYYAPVLWAVENGVTKGTSDTTFSPADTCTRGQVVTFLWRAKGSPEPESTENPFTDIKESDYFYKAVLWAKENKITTGATATTFAPNAGCTRAQVVTFLWRTEGEPKPTSSKNPFRDVTGGYYYDAVLWAVEMGITKGTTDTTFSPDATCTRGQIVTFLYRDLA